MQAAWLLLVGLGAGNLAQPASTFSPSMQEFKGYVFKIMGGQDKQGFPMKQGVLVPGRVQLLMKPGDSCFRGFGRRKGERRRKSVRGCIVSQDLSVLNLMIVKAGRSLQCCVPCLLHSRSAIAGRPHRWHQPQLLRAPCSELQSSCSPSGTTQHVAGVHLGLTHSKPGLAQRSSASGSRRPRKLTGWLNLQGLAPCLG